MMTELDLKAKKSYLRHITGRIAIGGICFIVFFGSLIWSIALFNIKQLEHPIKIDKSYEQNTSIERGK